jgi:hypothetical protein
MSLAADAAANTAGTMRRGLRALEAPLLPAPQPHASVTHMQPRTRASHLAVEHVTQRQPVEHLAEHIQHERAVLGLDLRRRRSVCVCVCHGAVHVDVCAQR